MLEILEEILDIDFLEGILSNSTDKEQLSIIKIRPVLIKENLLFQITKYQGKKVLHNNYKKEELVEELKHYFLGEEVRFRQAEFTTKKQKVLILISKKGKITIKKKKHAWRDIPMEKTNLSHNRTKQYILKEGMNAPFLQDLGVMTKEGKIVNAKYDKFKQINRFLEFIEDILPSLPKDREITIIDFGCGKSYLTFAMYYYLKELKQYNIKVIGLDLKKDVILYCNQLSKKYGYENLTFLEGDIASYEGVDKVDMVVTLHACDTATDYALYKAVQWGAEVILSVPCCQHELNQNMQCDTLDSIFQYGLIKERTAALMTDALRANVLEMQGYKTQILEFIDMEHTPKNLLIRAVKRKEKVHAKDKGSIKQREAYENMIALLGYKPTLGKLFEK